jgi:hypothetical protein
MLENKVEELKNNFDNQLINTTTKNIKINNTLKINTSIELNI